MSSSDDQQPLKFSNTREYAPQREALVRRLCPDLKCHWCGVDLDVDKVDLDHVHDRTYILHRLNRWQRLRVMQREWLAAGGRVGHWIVGACETCNAKRAHQRSQGGRQQFYTGSRKAKRNRRGRGYSSASYTTRQAEHYRAQMEREANDAPPF